MSADVVGYSRLMGVDEDGTLAALQAHRAELIDPKIAEHGGRIVKTMGDGLLLEFPSVVNAVRCVIEVQQGMAERNAGVDEARRIAFRVGVNQGDIIIEGEDIHGDGVNVAARLQGIAEPGGVSISRRVHEDVRNRLDTIFEDTGEQELKNISRPIQVWRWAPGATVVSETKADNPALTLPNKPSIAVLPFENMSGDPEQEYFADGMTEDIITELSRFEVLFVISRNSSYSYKGQHIDIRAIAKELGVRFILEGSVRKAGPKVRITAQLISGQDGSHIWAERYDGGLEDVFELQEQVTTQVVGTITPKITEVELERAGRGDRIFDEAHELAWRTQETRRIAMRNRDPAILNRAVAMGIRAVELNAKCGMAYQVICLGYFSQSMSHWGNDPSASAKLSEEWAKKYHSELPNSYMAYHCRGMARFRTSQFQDAIRDFRKAHELNPNDAAVLWMWANCEARAGAFEDAKKHAHMAIRLCSGKDERVGTAYSALATVAYLDNDTAGFEDWAEKALHMMPYLSPIRAMMVAYAAEVGNQSISDAQCSELMQTSPNYIGNLLRGEDSLFLNPEHNSKLLDGLRKAGFSG